MEYVCARINGKHSFGNQVRAICSHTLERTHDTQKTVVRVRQTKCTAAAWICANNHASTNEKHIDTTTHGTVN